MTRRTIGGVPRRGASLTDQIDRWNRSPVSKRKDLPVARTTDYTAQRADAGARYAAACVELAAAMVDLAALDSLAQPAGPTVTGDEARPYTFAAGNLADALPDLRHREFMPNPPKGLRAARAARRTEIAANSATQQSQPENGEP